MTITLPALASATDRIGEWWRAQLAASRARAAVVALVFAFGASGLLWLDARDRDVLQELAQKRALITRTEQVGPTELWGQRRAETDALRRQAEARLWEAETDGLAQANFQSWIADQANQAGLQIGDIRTTINTTTSNLLKLRQMSTQLSGRFEADAFFKLLQTIATHQQMVVVEQLEIQLGPAPRFDLTLSGFLRPMPKT
jgi:hypothetical protein